MSDAKKLRDAAGNLRKGLWRMARGSRRWRQLDRRLRAFESELDRYLDDVATAEDPLIRLARGDEVSRAERVALGLRRLDH